ncbi:hypothetical protein LWI29_013682 [Acer saccharum]|uniref:Dof zinc finger protein n=1 Tax=Acer saccharum TaxID=4024 RepID=A0AA39TDR5_ACESA|nr:hypothetical protein LWI29_013682 [Acer saccharum]
MVFPSSVPVYLDTSNWQQQPLNHHHHHHLQHGGNENPSLHHQHHQHHQQQQQQLLPPLPQAPPHVGGGGGGGGVPAGGGSVRPGSMADRARQAKLPQPETALKCPRCDSINTKFCYFNNYSLSQPRHFCKTCRRYWTRGGALRNVPVGGGCRRNKKSKSTSKSPASSTEKLQMGSNNSTTPSSSLPSEIILPNLSQQNPQLPFMSSLQNLTHQYNLGNLGLNFGGFQAHQIGSASSVGNGGQNDVGFQIGSNSSISSAIFPNFFEPSTGGYSFHHSGEGIEAAPSSLVGENSRVSQQEAAPVKMEDNQAGLNLARPFLGVSENNNNNQYWSGNTWTDLSGLNSSSANHLI